MAFDFAKGFNKLIDANNSLNHAVNSVIGKDVFKDAKKIEGPRDFAEYESFPRYSVPEPDQWETKNGEEKQFSVQGNAVTISQALDLCLRYRKDFLICASYYTERFKYMYEQCATDFDSFLYYFEPMYKEGLYPMLQRGYSLLLPLGVFDSDLENFANSHINKYSKAYDAYQMVAGIEIKQNATASQAGNLVGNSVQMRGGGFGLKGAIKGAAKAEVFNLGLSAIGKFVEHQSSMSQEEKASVWDKFNKEELFRLVKDDYENVFFTLIQILSDKGLIGEASVEISKESETIYMNLQNPLFPAEQFLPTIIKLINRNPFISAYYNLLENKLGKNDEINNLRNYFSA